MGVLSNFKKNGRAEMKELQKDVAQIIEIVKNEGVKERDFSARNNKFDAFERDLKAKIEKVFDEKLVTLFYDMRKQLNRIATQEEYTAEYLKIATAKIKQQVWCDEIVAVFNQDFIENCVTWRADRAYKSNLIEVMTAMQLETKGYTVFKELFIDYVAGVDLVAIKDNKVWYIHITKDSTWSRDKVLTKGTYRDYWIDGKKVNYQRNFENHVELFYSNDEGANNTIKNGLPLFRFDYVMDALDERHSFNWDSSNQLNNLMRRLKSYGVANKGYEWTSTNNKMVVK